MLINRLGISRVIGLDLEIVGETLRIEDGLRIADEGREAVMGITAGTPVGWIEIGNTYGLGAVVAGGMAGGGEIAPGILPPRAP